MGAPGSLQTIEERRTLFQGIQETTMKTRSSMLSSLAIAALATVTLSSTQALAKGGMGGMHSFSAMRTTPVVVTKYRALNTTTTVKKLTARNTTALTRKLTTNKVLTGI